jgi:hypothetical protein
MTPNSAVSWSAGQLVVGNASPTAAHGPCRDRTIAQSGEQTNTVRPADECQLAMVLTLRVPQGQGE